MTSRKRILVAVIGVLAAAVLATAAYAAFTTTATGGGTARSATMPRVQDFTLANAGGPNVALSWDPVEIADTPFDEAGGMYRVMQYDSPTASTGREVCFTMSTTCEDRVTSNGSKYYSVQTVLHNWTGQASTFKDVTVTLNGPSITPVHPTAAGQYQLADWDGLCGSAAGDICAGVVPDTGTQISTVEVSVRQAGAEGLYWNGSEFGASEEMFHASVDTSEARLALPSTALAVGDYVARFRATDTADQTNTVTAAFSIIPVPVQKVVPTLEITSPTTISQTEATVYYAGTTTGTEEYHKDITVRVYSGSNTSQAPVRELLATRSAQTWSVTDTNPLSPGTYTVVATQICDGCPNGANGVSAPVTLTITQPLPNTPGSLTATTVSANRIDLAWTDASSNETGFTIEQSTNGGTTWAPLATPGANVTSYQHTGLTCGQTRHYRVRSNGAGGSSAWSNTANATTTVCPPAAPDTLVRGTMTFNSIALSWNDKSTNETAFEIERTGGSGTVVLTHPVTNGASTGTVSYTDTTVTCGTAYTYRVRAKNAGGESAYTSTVSGTPTCPTPPAAPGGLTVSPVTNNASSLSLSWNNVTGETNFVVQRLVPNTTTYETIATLDANVLTYTDSSLNCGLSRTYRVIARNTGNPAGYQDSSASSSATGTTVACNSTIHVSSTSISASNGNGPNTGSWRGSLTVVLASPGGSIRGTTTVTVKWDGGTATCTTSNNGNTCTALTQFVSRADVASLTMSVDDVAHGSLTYNPAANAVATRSVNRPA